MCTNLPGEGSEGEAFSHLSYAGVGVADLHHHRKRRHAHLMSENRVLASFCHPNMGKIFVKSKLKCSNDHFLVVRIKSLLDQRKLLGAKPPMSVDELGKLKLWKENFFSVFFFKERVAKTSAALSAYRPRLVAHVVDGREGVDARYASVLQPNDQVPKILVLGHAEGMLADEHKVRFERPGGRNQE